MDLLSASINPNEKITRHQTQAQQFAHSICQLLLIYSLAKQKKQKKFQR